MGYRPRTGGVSVETLQKDGFNQRDEKNIVLKRILFIHKNFTSNTTIE